MTPTLHQAAENVRSGRTTPVELLDACLQRIDRLEPTVHAWVLVDRDGARADAERLTGELKRGFRRGPLHGLPLGIKDIFDVFDWPTAAGSRRWADSRARHDATVVRRLREAGAVLLGKTVTTQYASFDPPITRNPWNVERTPGGSSSGSAAAVACGMCLGALGSQTGGSITRPASYCGVAGLKPTWGRVSVHGVLALAASMDHVGPIAPCVRDLALLFSVIAGRDPLDPCSADRATPNTSALSAPATPPRLGRVRGLFEDRADPAVRTMMDEVVHRLTERGAVVREVALPAGFGEVIARHRTIMAVEAAAYHEPRLRKHPEEYDPNIRALLEEGLSCSAAEYARCKEHQARLTVETASCFEGTDALLTPATTSPAPSKATTGDPAFNSPWSYTGVPTVSFPAAWTTDGLPLAVQLVGRAWSEAELLATALWCEVALGCDRRGVSV